ncbi:inactive CLIP domain-containing serine protease A30 [Aedes albopictus]|uniref:Peptidase S1 domain-containing protein n=1 Tax=Aedes albopictus TaxID=7160 RepID=A0ABM1Z1R7_AEDAL
MEAAIRLAVWCILLLCGLIQNGLAASDTVPKDYTNMPCDLPSGKDGICVFAYLCNNDVINTDGDNILDLRFTDVCEDYFLKCCSKESPCMERSGTCLPKNQCTADLNASKYTGFKNSEECDWSGYQCCPNDAVKQGPISTNLTNEENCDVDSICVPDDKCMINADGGNVVEARMSICNGLNTCCPRNKIKTNNSASINDTCESMGGTCIRKDECESPFILDVRTEICADPGFECCMGDNQPATTLKPSLEGKKCFNNNGVCTPPTDCKGIKYTDRRKECGSLVCCDSPIPETTTATTTTTTTKTATTSTTSPGRQPTTQKPDIDTERPDDRTCDSLGGTCVADRDCQRKADQQSVDCAVDTVCCLSKRPTDVPTVSVDDLDIKECGYRNEDGIKFKTINRNDGEAQYGEFPWVVAILLADSGKVKLRCAGTLIDPEIVLTTAECIKEYKRKPEQLIIRAGEWDMAATMEPISPQERRVVKMKIHEKFNPHSLVNNIALLFLDDKFDLTPTINTVCLPPQDFTIDNGYVIATGWGTTPQNRTKYQHILKSMELPYRQKSDCEQILKRATRNNRFKLDSSFICAGGEFGQDTCQGDAGSPIIFPIPDTSDLRYFAVGMVSWGVGCGRPGIPSVNTDIGKFREWIDSKIDEEQLHMHYYDFQPQD